MSEPRINSNTRKLGEAQRLLAAARVEMAANPKSGKARGRVSVINEEVRRLEQQIARGHA